MKNQTIWIFILAVVVVAGGAYWYNTQNTSRPVPTAATEQPVQQQTTGTKPQAVVQPSSQTTQTPSAPSASIDASSLISTVATPTLTGTVSGTLAICVEIGKDSMPKNAGDAQGIKIIPNSVFQSCGPHDSNFSIANGRWSMGTAVNVSNIFSNGTYTVGVYDDTPGGNFGNLLTSGTLIVTIPASSLNTYSSSQYGFTVQYPGGIQINTSAGSQQSYTANINNGTQVAVIGPIEKSFTANEPGWGTNGVVTSTGKVTVSVSTNSTDVAHCMTAPSAVEIGPSNITTKNMNGVNFLSYDVRDPAAGLLELNHTYTTLRNGICYSIDANISGAESGHMNASDGAANDSVLSQLTAKLDSISQSFKFTN